MAKIDPDIADGVWNDVSSLLKLDPGNGEIRCQVGRLLSGFRADLVNRSDVHPNAVRKLLADCEKKAKAFEKALAPLATNSERGAKMSASRQLSLASGLRFDEMNVVLGRVHQMVLGCKKGLAGLPGRRGPTSQTSRDVLILKLDGVLGARRRQISNKAFARALRTLMVAAGSNRIPDQISLETTVRKVRRSLNARAKR
jgi:hypothetical protein